ncbi:hypothetical protein BD414DRAFT_10528 [Trametes punicea]|nr:hypothetical protein BD414DRAFT_10528 [Trametes punicea]
MVVWRALSAASCLLPSAETTSKRHLYPCGRLETTDRDAIYPNRQSISCVDHPIERDLSFLAHLSWALTRSAINFSNASPPRTSALPYH